MKKYIQNFKVYLSENQITQENGVKWLGDYQGEQARQLYDKYAVKPEYINTRHLYAKGAGDLPYLGEPLYSINEEYSPTLNTRSNHAQEKVEEIFDVLYDGEVEAPCQLNHVSCSHYESPSAAQKIVLSKEWYSSTPVTHLYHMGCYAALPAIRVSKAYVADGSKKVDVVHTELCSYHLDKENISPEQVIMNTLFADGAIKYSVTNDDYFKSTKEPAFEIITQKEIVVPGSEKEMSWKLGSHGFMMRLTRNVPAMLAKHIEVYMRQIFSDAGLDWEKDKDSVVFAVHPGGPKIIELVQKMLFLSEDQVKHSKKILKSRGNMSSATLPHIWNEILKDKEIKSNTFVATVAFGPGLTMTGAILKLCRH
jgi:predicted naringenin-chalcone synthase